jgi:hypothetical protein
MAVFGEIIGAFCMTISNEQGVLVGAEVKLVYHRLRWVDMKTAAYIYLAVACGMLGVVLTYAMLFVCLYFQIDVAKNLWIITIPIVTAISLNIFLIEWLSRRKKK